MKSFLFFLGILLVTSGLSIQAAVLDPRAQDVLEYWFGTLNDVKEYPKDKFSLWFGKNPQTDQEIHDKFEDLVIEASNNHLDHWKESPKGRLALIIVMDQFSRNIYRNSPQAFALDPIAQQLVQDGLNLCEDLELFPIERVFFYLPLEHAENLGQQELSVQKFNELVMDSLCAIQPDMKQFAQYAYKHYEIIARFGRFPHRNQILGRQSTPEEIEFLKEPGSSF